MTTGQNAPPPAPRPQPTPPGAEPARTQQKPDRTPLWAATITAAGGILAAVLAVAGGWLHYSGPGSAAAPAQTVSSPAAPPANHPRPSTNSTPPTSQPTTASAPVYLAALTGKGDVPQSGSWTMLSHLYTHSLGYAGAGGCGSTPSVNYALNGKYKSFDATVGVNDTADQADQGPPTTATQVHYTVYANPGGGQMTTVADVTAEWGNPQNIHVNVHGASLLTLQTSGDNPATCLAFDSEAVWGNARLLP
jgi:NPCBM/NEW2 domain-containing protein